MKSQPRFREVTDAVPMNREVGEIVHSRRDIGTWGAAVVGRQGVIVSTLACKLSYDLSHLPGLQRNPWNSQLPSPKFWGGRLRIARCLLAFQTGCWTLLI